MLTYPLDRRGERPIYRYLFECIRDDILSGVLQTGEKLPSKRQLARNLNISVITVQAAYAELQLEGFIEGVEKRGYFVLDVDAGIPVIPAAPEKSVPAPAAVSGATRIAGTGSASPATAPAGRGSNAAGADPCPASPGPGRPAADTEAGAGTGANTEEPFANLASGAVLPVDFPFASWGKSVRAALKSESGSLLKSSPPNGLPELRAAIAEHLLRYRGIAVDANQIVVGSGAEYLYSLLVNLLGRDRLYAAEDPGYQTFSRLLELNGAAVLPVPIDDSGICPPQLEQSGASVVHVSPAHHFPTGIVMPMGRRRELMQWLDAGGIKSGGKSGSETRSETDSNAGAERWLIEDDYDCELRLRGRPVSTLFSLSRQSRVIYMNTFSRTLSPAMRVAYIVLPEALAAFHRETCRSFNCTVPSLEQLALARFLADGSFDRHLARLRTAGVNRRTTLLQCIRQSDLSGFAVIDERDAGLHFMLHLKNVGADAPTQEALRRTIRDRGIQIAFLDDYSRSAESAFARENTLIIHYAALPPERYAETVRRLSAALRSAGIRPA